MIKKKYKVIKLEESKVEFYGTKVEIKLKKADVVSWPKLELIQKAWNSHSNIY